MNLSSLELLNEAKRHYSKSGIVAAFCLAALFGLLSFTWNSHSLTLFNGLATPLTFAVCGYLLVTLPLASGWVVEKKNLIIFLLLAAWVLVADTRSGEFLPALARDTHWLLAAFLSVSITHLFRRLDHVMGVLQFVAATCILVLLLKLLATADTHVHWLLPPVFGHIRHLGLTIGMFTILLYLPGGDSQRAKLFCRLARIAGMSLVIWSGTRASILGILIAVSIIGLLLKEKRFLIEVVTDIAIAALLSRIPPPALPDAYDIMGRAFGAKSLNELSSFRLSMWADAINWLAGHERLFLGAGGNGFARIQTMWHAQIFPPDHIQPHNIVVQILTDWGIPGLALSLALMFSILLGSVKCLCADASRSLAFGALGYIFVTSMFDATLYHLEFLMYFSTIMGVIKASNQTGIKADTVCIPKGIVVAVLISVIGIHLSVAEYRIGLPWYFPTR